MGTVILTPGPALALTWATPLKNPVVRWQEHVSAGVHFFTCSILDNQRCQMNCGTWAKSE